VQPAHARLRGLAKSHVDDVEPLGRGRSEASSSVIGSILGAEEAGVIAQSARLADPPDRFGRRMEGAGVTVALVGTSEPSEMLHRREFVDSGEVDAESITSKMKDFCGIFECEWGS